MEIHYCDMCGIPVKDGSFFMLYIANPTWNNGEELTEEVMREHYARIEKETKEVCPKCKKIFDDIFAYRMDGIIKMAKECQDTFALPPFGAEKPIEEKQIAEKKKKNKK